MYTETYKEGVNRMDKLTAKAAEWLAIPNNTKKEMCSLMGITKPTLDKRLQGKSKWTFSDAKIIATLTDSTLEELTGN